MSTPLCVVILTVSDSVSRGRSEDKSGPAVQERCAQLGWQVTGMQTVADEQGVIQMKLAELADSGSADVILTTGGTGLSLRDVTPEATAAACSRMIPGLGEQMREMGRRSNPRAVLSRATAGVRGRTIIVNLPGSPRGAVESLDAVAGLLPHAIEVLQGARHD